MNPTLKEILAMQSAGKVSPPEQQKPSSPGADRGPVPASGKELPEALRASARPTLIPPMPKVCKEVAASVPYSRMGDERIEYLVEQIRSLEDKERTALRIHVEHFLKHMLGIGASDIDFGGPASNGMIWYRVDGDKRPDEGMGKYTITETNVLLLNLLSRSQVEVLMHERSLDLSYQLPIEGKDGRRRRFRATMYFDLDDLGLNMRAIQDEIRPLKSLGFHPMIEKGLMFRHVRDGLTLVTGVTGSGKSTTLDAVVDANNVDVAGHVVVISKPIEFMHVSKKCIIRHREVGKDVPSFKDGIVQSLRQDPDIVVIGELRDPTTISAAIEITDSGHKVFSTLHTSSAVESIDRIIGEYPPDEQDRIRNRLADVLRCIISQKLCPKIGGGRILSKEVLWMTPSASAAIKNDNAGEIYQMMWESTAHGQTTLEQDLARLLKQGLISAETAMDYANNKRRLRQLIG